MKTKLTMLVVGALAALVLPAGANAGEFTADCEVGGYCSTVIAGGMTEITNSNGELMKCNSVEGETSMTNGSSTGSASLV